MPEFRSYDRLRHLTREALGRSNAGNPMRESFKAHPVGREFIEFDDMMMEAHMASHVCLFAGVAGWPPEVEPWAIHLEHSRLEIDLALEWEDRGIPLRESVPLLRAAMLRFQALPEDVRAALWESPAAQEAITAAEGYLASAENPE